MSAAPHYQPKHRSSSRLRARCKGLLKDRRVLTAAACLLVISSVALAVPFDFHLTLEHKLRRHDGAGGAATSSPAVSDTDALALRIAPNLGNRDPASRPSAVAIPAPRASGVLSSRLIMLLRALWACAAVMLAVQVCKEWVRVILVRLRKEHKPLLLAHAEWPTISLLVLPHGDAQTQEQRYDALNTHSFDYPAGRLHFVAPYLADEAGVRDAVFRLVRGHPERVHPLAIGPDDESSLAALMPRAMAMSVGSALVVVDQHLPRDPAWLRQAVSPLLDPAVGAVLYRTIPTEIGDALANRLAALADHSDVLIATQEDALDLLLCGKARIRALRRQAYKTIEDNTPSGLAPDGAAIILGFARQGWQTTLLAHVHADVPNRTRDVIRSPRLHPLIALRAMQLTPIAWARRIPQATRRQGSAVFFSAALPLIWLTALVCGILLYALGDILFATFAMALCAATCFDPHGHPRPAFSIAAAARMAGMREEIQLLPLAAFCFIDRMREGFRVTLSRHRRAKTASPATVAGAASADEQATA